MSVEQIPLRTVPKAVPREWFSWGLFCWHTQHEIKMLVERIPLRTVPKTVPREWFSWYSIKMLELDLFGWLVIRADPAENCFQGFSQGSGFLGVSSAGHTQQKIDKLDMDFLS